MIIEKRLYAPKEIIVKNGGALAISLSGVYDAINKGTIPTVKVGNRRLVPYWFLEQLLRQPGETTTMAHRPIPNRQASRTEVLARY